MSHCLTLQNTESMSEFSTLTELASEDVNLNKHEQLKIIHILDSNNQLTEFNWQVSLEEDAHYEHWLINLSKVNVSYKLNVNLKAKAATFKFRGVLLGKNKSRLQHQLKVEHAADNTKTDIISHGIADHQSLVSFDGLMKVNEKIKGVEAHELLKNLLLSNSAQIDAKPELEIYSNEIACTHGASVGDLDEDALFYLQSRGFSADEAKNLLLKTFATAFLQQVQNDKLSLWLEQQILREINA